jgi:hypothetical protein
MKESPPIRRWTEFVVRRRRWFLLAALTVTAALASRVGHLRVEIDPNRFLPQSHPYVVTSDRVEDIFGSRSVLVIGITASAGDIYDPAILAKVERITHRLREVPGVVKSSILSFSANKAKSITGTAEGMEVRPLMPAVPEDAAAMRLLRQRVASNPAYADILVSKDGRSVAVLADFKDDPQGFQSIMSKVKPIVDAERDSSVRIALGGLPVMLGTLEIFSQRMGVLLPLATLLIAVVLWFAFRSVQGLVLPLVTALLAVTWSLGVMSWLGVPLDVFNATTPVLILAVASGHAVQILKRYYEEFQRQRALTPDDLAAANRQAVVESLTHVGPVMLVAGVIAATGFLSLMVFEISSVRTFGIMSACGILSSLVLELTLIPALRSSMRPPRIRLGQRPGALQGAMARLADWVSGPRAGTIMIVAAVVLGVSLWGATRIRYAEALKEWFFTSLPVIQDDNHLNQSFAGTNTLYVLAESKTPGRMQDPDVLLAIDRMQKHLQADPNVGRSLSIADFVRRMNQAVHADDPRYDVIPEQRELIAQYLFLYANSGDPGDFDTYVDNDYQRANIWALLKEHDTAKLQHMVRDLKAFAARTYPPDVTVSFGGTVAQGTAILEIVGRAKILNMLQVAAVFFVLSSLVFRSLLAGFLVVIPLAMTVAFNFGLMGWTGIPYNINNSITAAMAVGVGADYVIYLLFRLREEQALGGSPADAMRRALVGAGSAIVFVAGAVAAGYSVLLLSYGFWNHIWMGILISTAMMTSALAAVSLVPVLVVWLRPAFIYNGRTPSLPAASTAAVVLAAGLALVYGSDARAAEPPTAEQLMRQNFLVDKVAGSRADVSFTLHNEHGQERVRESITSTRLQDNGLDNQRLVLFQAPADVKGTSILLVEHSKADDDMWIFLPALKKVRRLVASNKKDSFAGTDFSYGDVIGYAVDDWKHTLAGEETIAGDACYVVESTPATAAVKDASGYSKRRTYISKARLVTLRMEAWDTEGQKLKEEAYDAIQNVDPGHGKWFAMHAVARNLQTGHSTDVVFRNYRLDPAIPQEVFSVRTLEFGS